MIRKVVRWLLSKIVRILFRVRIEGLGQPIQASRLIIVANHESFLDGLFLGLFLPFDPVFVVHTGVTGNRFFRLVLTWVDHLAVDPANPMAVKKVIKLVEEGRPVVIFPEGRITVTGSLMKVYAGPGFVAAKTGATILPVRLDGPARSLFSRLSKKGAPRRLFPRVTLSVRPPAAITMPEDGTARQRRAMAGESMRRIMQKMLCDSRPKQTLFEGLLEAISIHGRGRAVVEDIKQTEYSYGTLLKMTLALGRIIAKQSAPGECVGILMPNLAPTLGMLIGSSAMGRVPAMLNFKAGAAGMSDACAAARIRTVFTSRAFVQQAKLEADLAALPGVAIKYLEDLKEQVGFGDKLWVLRGMLFPKTIERRPDPEGPAVVLFTSGSEGRPKGVLLSHRALMSNIAQVRSVIEFSTDDKVLNALPLFHSFGLTAGTLLPVMTGMRLFLYPSPLHYRVIPELAYDRSCSILFGTNTFLTNYAKYAHPYDFYRLRYVVAGAEKLSESVRSLWFEKFGIRILEGYGATETAPVLAVNTPMAYKTGTVGQFLPAVEYRLDPVPGIDAGGMLSVRGPNVMSGYYRVDAPGALEPPKARAGEGWYETGDIVSVDENGFVSIVGRVKRFAKVAGEMISLEAVERVASFAAPAALHGASALPDGARGESIVLVTTDKTLTRDALAGSARTLGLPELALPRKILRVDSLPLLGTGKVDYAALRRFAEAS